MKMLRQAAVAVGMAALAFLASCGGGGGGGGRDLTLRIQQASLQITTEEGMPGSGALEAALVGEDADVYYTVAIEGDGIADVSLQQGPDVDTFHFSTNPAMAPGAHHGTIRLDACFDAACKRHLTGSPARVPYTLVVRRGLRAMPDALQFKAVSGNESSPQAVEVQLPEGATDYTVRGNLPWIQILDKTPAGFNVRLGSVPSGEHRSHIDIYSGDRQFTLPITYIVAPPPGGEHDIIFGVEPAPLQSVQGRPSEPFMLAVSPPTWNPSVTVEPCFPSPGQPDLQVQTTPVEGGYVLVSNAADVAAGHYTGCLKFIYAAASHPTIRWYPVELTVSAPAP